MKKSFATLGPAAVLLASCSTPMFGPHAGPPANPKTVVVMVQNGIIVVPQGVARVLQGNGAVRWEVDNPDLYRFADNGIEFKRSSQALPAGCLQQGDAGKTYPDCRSLHDGRTFQCIKAVRAEGTCYDYTVRLVPAPGSGAQAVPPLDPWIVNE